jgi:folate-dependent phosphoribosylglycinamide formyltransferase PurN
MRRVVVLGRRTPTSYLMVNALLARFDVALVVWERGGLKPALRMWSRRRRRLGTLKVAAQSLFVAYDRLAIRPASRARIDALLAGHDVRAPDGRVPTLEVDDINAPEVVRAVRDAAPGCGVVTGTSILRTPVMESAPVWLNIHCGITPRYRGVHGAFWAVQEGRPELAGVTVHQIDAGIDTGGIVAQATIALEGDDTYRTLPVKQYLAGTPLMVAAVQAALDGELRTTRRADLESCLWSSPTVPEYLAFRRRLRQAAGASVPTAG